MAVISGKTGYVALAGVGVACIRDWSLDDKIADKKYACSATRGGTARANAPRSWGGTFKGYGHTPPVIPGASATAQFVLTGTTGYEGTIKVITSKVICKIEEGGQIEYEITFLGSGALTKSSTLTVATPTAFGTEYAADLGKVSIATPAASPSFADIADVRSWELTMSVAGLPYSSSSTAQETAAATGVFDAEISIDCFFSDPTVAAMPVAGDVKHVRLFVDGSTYYDCKWIRFTEPTQPKLDIEGGALVGGTLKGALQGAYPIGGTPAGGWIKNPAGTAVWDGST